MNLFWVVVSMLSWAGRRWVGAAGPMLNKVRVDGVSCWPSQIRIDSVGRHICSDVRQDEPTKCPGERPEGGKGYEKKQGECRQERRERMSQDWLKSSVHSMAKICSYTLISDHHITKESAFCITA